MTTITRLRAALSALNLAVCTTREIDAKYDTFAQAEDDLRSVIAEMESAEPVAQLHPNHFKPNPDGSAWCREVLLYSPNNEGDKLGGVNTRVKVYTHPKTEPAVEPLPSIESGYWESLNIPGLTIAQKADPVQEPKGCLRCNTPKKCAVHGCSPLTWPAETEPVQEPVIQGPVIQGPVAAWQERQQGMYGWSQWYDCSPRTDFPKGLQQVSGGITYQWRPLYAAPQAKHGVNQGLLDALKDSWNPMLPSSEREAKARAAIAAATQEKDR